VAQHVLRRYAPDYRRYSFLERGSDERQYCSPRIDLPVVCIMRTKHGVYPEYHTSLDDLSLISPEGLDGAYEVLKGCLSALEENYKYRATVPCEPQLGKRGLYPSLSTKESSKQVANTVNVLAYADGDADLLRIAEIIGADVMECVDVATRLERHGLLERV
jgi:aminopeptidase-like protein